MSVNDSLLVIVLAQAVLYGTPLLYAALGELLAERSGVLNLGVEGMMLFGAAVGYWVTQTRRRQRRRRCSSLAVLAAAAVAGAAMAAIHAFLTITLRANQIVSGLALTIFAGGLGLSAYFGNELDLADVPRDVPVRRRSTSSGSATCPCSGRSSSTSPRSCTRPGRSRSLVGLYLGRTRWGLNVRAVGEAPASADAMGINVTLYRYVHVLVGGAFAGVGGACYSLSITPGWTVGRHARERRGLDRDRARDLRFLAGGALPRGRVPLRGAVGAPVRAAGARRDVAPEFLHVAAVRHDHRRARASSRRASPSVVSAPRPRSEFRTCARSGRTTAWTS